MGAGGEEEGDLRITSEPEPDPRDVEAVKEGLLAFNEARCGPGHPVPVHVFARDAAGAVVGGLIGARRWGFVHVDKLWVREDLRGRGLGGRLLARAEEEARAAGCTDAVLDTFDFQARPFYEKRGYRLYAALEGFPPGHRQFYLRKKLAGTEPEDDVHALDPRAVLG